MSIGSNIKKAREAKGMSQEELGERVCVSRSTIAQFERDGRCPSVTLAVAIAEALETTLEYITNGVETTEEVS